MTAFQGIGSWPDVKATLRRDDGRPLSGGPCITSGTEKVTKATLLNYEDNAKFRDSVCLQTNVVYKVEVDFPKPLIPGETVLVDSVC